MSSGWLVRLGRLPDPLASATDTVVVAEGLTETAHSSQQVKPRRLELVWGVLESVTEGRVDSLA